MKNLDNFPISKVLKNIIDYLQVWSKWVREFASLRQHDTPNQGSKSQMEQELS